MAQKIKIKLKSFDYNLVDKSSDKIVKGCKDYWSDCKWSNTSTNKKRNFYRFEISSCK